MSLYGLDIIIDQNNNRFLIEINGIRSGMNGFRQVYGDNRVENKVYSMLAEKYGKLAVNNGTYSIKKFKKEHPIKYGLSYFLRPLLRNASNSILNSKKAEVAWLKDTADNSKTLHFDFDIYTGQQSTVINLINEELLHPTVNPLVAEDLTHNKYFQYVLLADSGVNMVESALVGLGATDEQKLDEMISKHNSFVVKPILGCCGLGVRFISKNEAARYRNTKGPTDEVSFMQLIYPKTIMYIEDLVEKSDFSFEAGVSVIQPFIEPETKYSAIRAIVCNGKFVDAYKKISDSPRVNLSQGAKAVAIDCDVSEYCENIVNVFESKANEYDFETYKKKLYFKHIEKIGKTSTDQRQINAMSPLLNAVGHLFSQR
jgi:glutathione synthase/RimK-type ligase-like ATP-grasp enzyme